MSSEDGLSTRKFVVCDCHVTLGFRSLCVDDGCCAVCSMEDIIERYRSEFILDRLKLGMPLSKVQCADVVY